MKSIKFSLLALAALAFNGFTFADETYHACDKQVSTNSIRMSVFNCSADKNQPWTIEVEVPDEEDGGTKMVNVHSTYQVKCNANHRCSVLMSDIYKKGAVIGNGKPGAYELDYNHYIDVDINGNATQYLIGTGPQFGGEVAGGETVSAATGKAAVTEASCAPQMDDDCTVNHKKVAKADLGKYLPVVNEADVRAAKGFCEYPICYNADNQPIGISK
jgi:hypothetical protein